MTLPVHLGRWLAEAGVASLPAEGRADCGACVQCGLGDLPTHLATFDPVSRCCTYLPALRSFQVGWILEDPSMTAGAATVRARIAAGVAVVPLGLMWPASFTAAYDEARATDGFGRRLALRCPHQLDDGRCGVWRHRNAICSTWFCRYERGAVGRSLWQAVRDALDAIEDGLAWWVVDELTPASRDALHDADLGWLDGRSPVTEEARRRVWGAWLGREEAFFLEAGRRVAALPWSEVRRAGGPRLAAALVAVEEARDDHANRRLPPGVRARALTPVRVEGDVAWVHGYPAYDPTPVPVALLTARSADEARAALRSVGQPDDDAALRALLDRGVLEVG